MKSRVRNGSAFLLGGRFRSGILPKMVDSSYLSSVLTPSKKCRYNFHISAQLIISIENLRLLKHASIVEVGELLNLDSLQISSPLPSN